MGARGKSKRKSGSMVWKGRQERFAIREVSDGDAYRAEDLNRKPKRDEEQETEGEGGDRYLAVYISMPMDTFFTDVYGD